MKAVVLRATFMLRAAGQEPPSPVSIEEAGVRQLRTLRRVYVDRLAGGETAAQMHDILLTSLDGAKLFVLIENPDRADATLRGAAEDLVFTEVHSSSDNLNAHTNFGSGRTTRTTGGSLWRNRHRRERVRPLGRAPP